MKELVGKTIRGVLVSDGESMLRFQCDDGPVTFEVYGRQGSEEAGMVCKTPSWKGSGLMSPLAAAALLFALTLPGRALAQEADVGLCTGHATPVVDGIDADGEICDGSAYQAAKNRFALLTMAAAVPMPSGCGKDVGEAVKARLDAAAEWLKAADRARVDAHAADLQIAALKYLIAEEHKNPAGVIDLRRLHDLGEDIQSQLATKSEFLSDAKADAAKAGKLAAEAKAAMLRCGKLARAKEHP